MTSDYELYKCFDCRVWDPENQPSVLAKLEADPDAYKDRWFKYVKTGMSLNIPGSGNIPLWVELILCDKHGKEAQDDSRQLADAGLQAP